MKTSLRHWLVALVCAGMALGAQAERIKDVAGIAGVRNNQLVGYGVVVGLDGTGDQTTQTPFTVQSMQSMLSQLGVNLPPGQSLQLKNVAAVMVTAVLPPFSQPGQNLDITVSSIGNAKSIKGGTLLLTPLKGADGQVYAMAQGNVVVAGAGASDHLCRRIGLGALHSFRVRPVGIRRGGFTRPRVRIATCGLSRAEFAPHGEGVPSLGS